MIETFGLASVHLLRNIKHPHEIVIPVKDIQELSFDM